MALIIHRCPECTHRDIDHPTSPSGKNSCSYANCPCLIPQRIVREKNPSELVMTWTGPENRPNPIITTPGTAFKGIDRTCACQECKTLCDKLGGMAS